MVEHYVEQMTNKLVKDTTDNQNKRLIVRYGLEVMVTTILQTSGFLVIGLIFNRIFELSFIMIGFAALRVFAGGYHASSRIKCFLSSVAIFTVGICIYEAKWIEECFLVLPIVILLVFAPKDHRNKRLSVKQKRVNRRRGLGLYVTVAGLYVVAQGQIAWYSDGLQLLLIGFFLESVTIIDWEVLAR